MRHRYGQEILTVKVEKSEDQKSFLIYNHNRKYTFKIEDPDEMAIIAKFMEDNTTGYFKAVYIESRNRFRLIEKIMDQCW
jgi:uncharacterized protein YrzB (UPF0473 family)